jgi:nicotinamidase-related amidase
LSHALVTTTLAGTPKLETLNPQETDMTKPGRRDVLLAASAGSLALATAGAVAQAQTPPNASAAASTIKAVLRDNSVLLMVDYMEKLLDSVKSHSRNLIVNNATALATIGKIHKLPTFILGDEGERLGTFNVKIHEPIPNAPKVPRHTVSAWREPAFVKAVEATGRRNLIVAGISTDMCVALLSLEARRAGYDVTLVVDASGSQSVEMHETDVARLIGAGVTPVTWVSLAAELMSDWRSPEGGDMTKLYSTFLGMS